MTREGCEEQGVLSKKELIRRSRGEELEGLLGAQLSVCHLQTLPIAHAILKGREAPGGLFSPTAGHNRVPLLTDRSVHVFNAQIKTLRS